MQVTDEMVRVAGDAIEHALFIEPAIDLDEVARAALSAALAAMWRDIKDAPKDGRVALVYRPLAHMTGDDPIALKNSSREINFAGKPRSQGDVRHTIPPMGHATSPTTCFSLPPHPNLARGMMQKRRQKDRSR